MRIKRLEEITKMLETQGSVEVAALSNLLGVTEKTIRQDLQKLEKMKIASRVHGGAVLKKSGNEIYPITPRKQKYSEEKQRIAKAALDFIEEGDVIILDSGTTTLELAKLLDKSVIVITNDPFIAFTLLHNEKITLFVTGGRLSRERGSFAYVGPDAIRTIYNYHAHKYFVGVSALDFEQGLMIFSTEEVEVKRAMLKSSKQAICMSDYSKFHQVAFSSFAQLKDIKHIITDNRITESDQLYFENIGVKLTIV